MVKIVLLFLKRIKKYKPTNVLIHDAASNSLRDELENENDDLKTQIVELRQALQMNMPHHEEEDNMDILLDSHMRDITNENRPQMSSAGLEVNNKHFRDLSNHELHQIKKIQFLTL